MIPCKNCICVPICRQKHYSGMIAECSIIDKYIEHSCYALRRNQKIIEELEETLKPEVWTFTLEHPYKDEYDGVKLIMPRDPKEAARYSENRVRS